MVAFVHLIIDGRGTERSNDRSVMARRSDLHKQAEYTCADPRSTYAFSLQSDGGPYILE